MTVIELVDTYLEMKTTIRRSTKHSYETMRKAIAEDQIASKRVKDVKIIDAKRFLLRVKDRRGYKSSTLEQVKTIIQPAFKMAIEDSIILRNPFDFPIRSICSNDSEKREALTEAQVKKLLDFIKGSGYYRRLYDPIYILFETGLRISELCGLTIRDVDLKNGEIHVTHQLKKDRGEIYIEKPKTAEGNRIIPIKKDVVEAFKRVIASRNAPDIEPIIDGLSGFIFLNGKGNPTVATEWSLYFKNICKAYNRTHVVQMPKVTPHICRHTYCTRLVASGVNVKVVQYLMGHTDITMTLRVYAHTDIQAVRKELATVDGTYNVRIV